MQRADISNHKELSVWILAMELVELTYKLTEGFPAKERYCLAAQIRRAAISIPSNIAEGAARGSSRDFTRFIKIAMGSLAELETQFLLAARLGYTSAGDVPEEPITAVRRMLIGLVRALRARG